MSKRSWCSFALVVLAIATLRSVLGYRPPRTNLVRRLCAHLPTIHSEHTSTAISGDAIFKSGNEYLQSAAVPNRRDEAWRHSSLQKLFPEKRKTVAKIDEEYLNDNLRALVSRLVDERCVGSHIVIVNGVYVSSLSNITDFGDRIFIGSIGSLGADSNIDVDVKERAYRLATLLPDADEAPCNSFGSSFVAALTMANCADVNCVVVPDNMQTEVPLQVLVCHVEAGGKQQQECAPAVPAVSGETKSFALSDGVEHVLPPAVVTGVAPHSASYPALLVLLGRDAQLEVHQSHHTIFPLMQIPQPKPADATDTPAPLFRPIGVPKAFVAGTTRVALAEGANLRHSYFQEAAESVSHLEVITADLHGNSSRYDLAVVQHGAEASRVNVHVEILGCGANCSLHGVTLAGPRQSLDLHTSIRHNSTKGTSRQQQRNVVADRGESIFKGRIRIPKHAQQSDSDQLCRSVLLGTRARLQVMPTLEISADNVQCSHGAAVADMDENAMFYLSARGIDRQEARKMLLKGFVFDMLRDCSLDPAVEARLMRKLHSLHESETRRSLTAAPSVQKYLSI